MLKKDALAFTSLLLLFALLISPVAYGKHWVLLGTAHVDKTEDHKTIHVGAEQGQFHRIQLHVEGAAVEFQRVVVHFGNGTKEELGVAERVAPGKKTREIELPGELRTIDGVELWYSKENLDTRPEVMLYGTR